MFFQLQAWFFTSKLRNRRSVVVRKFPYASPFRLYDATLIVITVQSILSHSILAFCVLDSLLESIASVHMSLDIELRISLLNPNPTFLLFPPASSLFGSSDSSLSNQSLVLNFNDYPSISSFFPPDTNTNVHISFSNSNSIFSLFSPARSMSSSSDNSLSNNLPILDFNDYPSISTFFPPDYSPSSSVSAQSKHFC